MDNVVKIIIKDKIINKTVALKVKEETQIQRIFEILVKRYDHPQKGNIQNILFTFQGEELPLEMTLSELIVKKNFKEEDRIEIQERPKSVKSLTIEKKEPDYIKMMSKGGTEFGKAIVEILIKGQILTREIAESALHSANIENRSVVTALIEGGYLKEKDILATVSRYLEISSVDLEGITIASDILNLIHKNEAEYYCILPIRRAGKRLAVAVVNPFDAETMNEIKMVTGTEIEPLLSTELSIRAKIKALYQRKNVQEEQALPAISEVPERWEEQPALDLFPDPKNDKTFPSKTEKNKLIIKDGRKIDAKDFSPEECNLPTIWEDKKLPDQDDWEEEKAKWKKPESIVRRKDQEEPSIEDNMVQGIDLSDIASLPDSYDIPAEISMESNITYEQSPALPEGIPILANMESDIPNAVEVESFTKEEAPSWEIEPSSEENVLEKDSQQKEDEWLIVSDQDPNAISDNIKTLPFSVAQAHEALESGSIAMTDEEKELENFLRSDITPKEAIVLSKPEEKADLKIPDSLSLDFGGSEEEDEDNIVSSDLVQTQKVSSFEREKTPQPSLAVPSQEDFLETFVDKKRKGMVLPETVTTIEEGKEILLGDSSEKIDKQTMPETVAPGPIVALQENISLPGDSRIAGGEMKRAIEQESPATEKGMDAEPRPVKQPPVIEGKKEPEPQKLQDHAVEPKPKQKPSPYTSKISRETTVRYYKKMYPFHSYPLVVLFSQKKLQDIAREVKQEISQSTGKAIHVEEKKPVVKIVPCFPGCLSVPQEVSLDITPEESYAKLWITPLCEGKIEDAQVQIWYQEKCIDTIGLSVQVVRQKAAKISAFLGVLIPVLSFVYDIFEPGLPKKYAILDTLYMYFQKIVELSGSVMNLGLIAGVFFLVLAVLFYVTKKSRQAEPLVSMIDFS